MKGVFTSAVVHVRGIGRKVLEDRENGFDNLMNTKLLSKRKMYIIT